MFIPWRVLYSYLPRLPAKTLRAAVGGQAIARVSPLQRLGSRPGVVLHDWLSKKGCKGGADGARIFKKSAEGKAAAPRPEIEETAANLLRPAARRMGKSGKSGRGFAGLFRGVARVEFS